MEPREIIYVEGLPKEITPSFDYLKSLKVANNYTEKGDLYKQGDIWNYKGSLEREDFESINEIFCSDQFHELRKDKEKFLERLRYALNREQPLTTSFGQLETIVPKSRRVSREDFFGKIFGLEKIVQDEPYEEIKTQTKDLSLNLSNYLIENLEKIFNKYGVPESAVSAQSLILKEAEGNGQYSSIGEYLKFGESDNANITVFIDEKPRGTIQFIRDKEKINSYIGAYPGEYYPTNIKVNVDGKEIIMEKNMWCINKQNTTLWELDEKIRKEILNEGETHKFIGGC